MGWASAPLPGNKAPKAPDTGVRDSVTCGPRCHAEGIRNVRAPNRMVRHAGRDGACEAVATDVAVACVVGVAGDVHDLVPQPTRTTPMQLPPAIIILWVR